MRNFDDTIRHIKSDLKDVLEILERPTVFEVMLNPFKRDDGAYEGHLWYEEAGIGMKRLTDSNGQPVIMRETKAEQIFAILAAANNTTVHDKNPILECKIPFFGHRFAGALKSVVPFPDFTIRKHSSQLFSLDELVTQDLMPQECVDTIRSWIRQKFNILIAGGTGSGKTTLANSILLEISNITPNDRVIILEDTPELQCKILNSLSRHVSDEVNISQLLRLTLRSRPDRIIVGEVRGHEAYTLLKAWNTGHPGGLATIHAFSADEALERFEQCILENKELSGSIIPRKQIASAINGIISIQKVTRRDGDKVNIVRKVTALREVTGYDNEYQRYGIVPSYTDKLGWE